MTGIANRKFSRDDAAELAGRLKAVADPTRLRIIAFLASRKDATGTEVVAAIGDLSQPTVTHHLHLLLAADLVWRHKEGVWTHWSLNRPGLRELVGDLMPRGSR